MLRIILNKKTQRIEKFVFDDTHDIVFIPDPMTDHQMHIAGHIQMMQDLLTGGLLIKNPSHHAIIKNLGE